MKKQFIHVPLDDILDNKGIILLTYVIYELPQRLIDLDVGKSFEFKCDAQSNPPSKFEWMQKLPILELEKDPRRPVYSRGFGKSLILKNVSYEHEGMWACTATTVIKGKD